MSLRSDNLDSIAELYTEDDFRQLVVAIEATPTSFGSLGEFEDHGERGLVRETSFGAHGAVVHRGERTFDDVRGHSTALSYLTCLSTSDRHPEQ